MDGAPPFATPVRAEAPRADELPLVKTEALPPQPPAPKPREAPAAGVVDVEARVAQPMRAAGGVPLGLPFLFVPSPPQPRPPQPQHRQQAAAASDSSMELVLRPMPSRAASLVGRRVAMWRRWHDYPGGRCTVFKGVIEAALPPARQDGWRWRVRLEDGTAEEAAWPELQSWLVHDEDNDGQAVQSPAPQPAAPAPPSAPAGGAGAAQRAGKQYKGVKPEGRLFRVVALTGGKRVSLGGFATAEAAAHAYDDGRRRCGQRVVNFPRAGTNELQAVRHERDLATLQRVEPGVDHTRCGVPPQRSPPQHAPRVEPRSKAEAREASAQCPWPMALRSSRAPSAVDTLPHVAAAQDAPPGEDDDSLVGRRVSLPYRETCSSSKAKYYEGVVVAKRAGAYDVRLKDGYMQRGVSIKMVLKHSVTSAAEADDAAGAAAGSHAPRQRGSRATAGNSSSHDAEAGAGGAGSGSLAVPIRGVWKAADNMYRAVLYLQHTCKPLGLFSNFKAAALAVDAAARKEGLQHLLNFPTTTAEHKAVTEHLKRPNVMSSLARKRSSESLARDAAAAAVPSPPPPRKRSRVAKPAASDDNAAAAPSEEPSAPHAAVGKAPSAAAALEGSDAVAFLRGIKPPLQDLDAIVQELHANELTMKYLAMVAQHNGTPAFALMRDDLFKALSIKRVTDQLVFTAALSALAPKA